MNEQRRENIRQLKTQIDLIKTDLKKVSSELSSILNEEQDAFDNMPEGLQSSYRGMCSEDAIERGKLAYMQYNPYFGRSVTTEIATGRTITCLFSGKDPETGKMVYKKWYFRPECQDKYDWRNTVKGDYGIDITEDEYNRLKTVLSSYTEIPSDGQVLNKLWGYTCFH